MKRPVSPRSVDFNIAHLPAVFVYLCILVGDLDTVPAGFTRYDISPGVRELLGGNE